MHEIGHNLGMRHDFDKRHKGKGCVKDNHIMNYGSSKEIWSECSKKDFQAHYLVIKDERKQWCMEGSECSNIKLGVGIYIKYFTKGGIS